MENQPITDILAKQFNSTIHDLEPEEYILTKEEEEYIVSNAILEAKRHKTWKLKGLGYTETQIVEKLSTYDWDAEIDRETLLKRCNSNKIYSLWQSEQREKDRIEREQKSQDLKKVWNARQFYSLMKWTSQEVYGKKLIVNAHNKRLISTLCFFYPGIAVWKRIWVIRRTRDY